MISKTFDIYSRIDSIDLNALMAAGSLNTNEWPKSKKYTVNLNGKDFSVTTYFTQASKKENDLSASYDACKAIEMMLSRDAVIEKLDARDPNRHTDAVNFATAEFDVNTPALSDSEVNHRLKFIRIVANLLNNPETIKEIANLAQKKKNGTLYKGRVLKIACSGIADYWNSVWAIVAQAKSDTSLSIVFDARITNPDDMENWNNDFISTYHEGLPVSEALKKVLE